ncbi:MAG: hypothetical protein M3O26_10660 [Pseudomonadota bacterium]|nr:hypothetical protein [Pseudomonadota bacterium]
MKKLSLLLPTLVLCLSACTALGKLSTLATPAGNQLIQAGIDVGVATAVGNNPATQKIKALSIKIIAQQIAADAVNPAATLAQLESTLNARVVALAPNAADAAAFMVFASTLQGFLNGKIQSDTSGKITASTSVAIVGLANAVVTATSFFGV